MQKNANKFGVNIENKVVTETSGYTAKEFKESQRKLIEGDYTVDMNPMPGFVLVEKIYDIPVLTLDMMRVHLGRDTSEVTKTLNQVNAFTSAKIVKVGADCAPLTVGAIPEIDINATLGITSVYIESVNADIATVSAQVASLPPAKRTGYISEALMVRACEYLFVRVNAIKGWR